MESTGAFSSIDEEVVLNIQVEEVTEDSLSIAPTFSTPEPAVQLTEARQTTTLPCHSSWQSRASVPAVLLDYEINNLLFCITINKAASKLPSTVGEWIIETLEKPRSATEAHSSRPIPS